MGATSHWTGDDDNNWRLLDRLLAAIRTEYHPPDEVLFALVTCMAKTIAMMDDDAQINNCLDQLRSVVEFQRALGDQ